MLAKILTKHYKKAILWILRSFINVSMVVYLKNIHIVEPVDLVLIIMHLVILNLFLKNIVFLLRTKHHLSKIIGDFHHYFIDDLALENYDFLIAFDVGVVYIENVYALILCV